MICEVLPHIVDKRAELLVHTPKVSGSDASLPVLAEVLLVRRARPKFPGNVLSSWLVNWGPIQKGILRSEVSPFLGFRFSNKFFTFSQ